MTNDDSQTSIRIKNGRRDPFPCSLPRHLTPPSEPPKRNDQRREQYGPEERDRRGFVHSSGVPVAPDDRRKSPSVDTALGEESAIFAGLPSLEHSVGYPADLYLPSQESQRRLQDNTPETCCLPDLYTR
jgi:hypothetical protein